MHQKTVQSGIVRSILQVRRKRKPTSRAVINSRKEAKLPPSWWEGYSFTDLLLAANKRATFRSLLMLLLGYLPFSIHRTSVVQP
jgi:hypothetical protein